MDIDYIKVSTVHGNGSRKASYQSLEKKILYKCQMPESVGQGETRRFVYVLPKFVLGDHEKLIIELKEEMGARKVFLSIRL